MKHDLVMTWQWLQMGMIVGFIFLLIKILLINVKTLHENEREIYLAAWLGAFVGYLSVLIATN